LQDAEREASLPLKEISVDDILDAQRREQEAKHDQERLVSRALKDRGLNLTADMSHDEMF
jgi:U6 snRNA-associated Sm-like protein LSm1